MALTRLQARDKYIIDSLALFLTRNLKVAYDAEVTSLAFPAPVKIVRGKPDDANQKLVVPCIGIETISGSEKARTYELGSNVLWRHKNFVLYCYPATVNGGASVDAADLLKTYIRDAFGTEYIQLVDYTQTTDVNNLIFCSDVAEITTLLDPIDRKAPSMLAEQKHRFDVHFGIRYPVLESNAT